MKEHRFIPGHWYCWVGPKERPSGWNGGGRMDRMLTGEPVQCTDNVGIYPIFPAIPRPDEDGGYWSWHSGLEFIWDCTN